jgi:hypothetical protein|tara:strand:- start:1260 stop:1454 length:195 start_codon:yes stop_codon:yes gene_type:complete
MLNERKNDMTKAQAELSLIKINADIEAKIIEHKNELGEYNKSIVEGELEYLWKVKNALTKIIAK